jgi:hypothetical protein
MTLVAFSEDFSVAWGATGAVVIGSFTAAMSWASHRQWLHEEPRREENQLGSA